MSIITTRRICQIFFMILFIWFCVVTTLGEQVWQLRGWPVNWLMELDPLTGLGVLLATHSLYAGLAWGLLSMMLTVFLGRFFCGWICPLGTVLQLAGYLGKMRIKQALRVKRNRPHPAQKIKYVLLLFLLAAASAEMIRFVFSASRQAPLLFWLIFSVLFLCLCAAVYLKWIASKRTVFFILGAVVLCGLGIAWLPAGTSWPAASLQSGLLDPLPLIYRSFNLVLAPIADSPVRLTSATNRFYDGSASIGILFLAIVLMGFRIPRFYCRFICPTGALFGLLSRWALWRITKLENRCQGCQQCEAFCEGACAPAEALQAHECVLCFNCQDQCRDAQIVFTSRPLTGGHRYAPDLARRDVLIASAAGLAAVPMLRLNGRLKSNWDSRLIRPPGALDESAFLNRCIKCGQCMRICPANVIAPALFQAGIEGLWTPVLNFKSGTSGCQFNCVACGYICPTSAIRPISVQERQGTGAYKKMGPIRIGTAFIDRGRCLPWSMDTPCIVCQENCPVSPKAIFTRIVYRPIRQASFTIKAVRESRLSLEDNNVALDHLATGDYYCRIEQQPLRPIVAVVENQLLLASEPAWRQTPQPVGKVTIVVRLQQPYIDPRQCIGCGVCEHECPVHGLRAVRVRGENESRTRRHRLTAS
ncbi:MAG: 4Fe-4S binding protein [Desulfobacteraceae bacterium]|nr:4Fe-4S binding protein [Desulfobacteraceae bacterium]